MFAHSYAKMDKEVIWDVATKDITTLLRFCDNILAESAKDSDRD
jgi:uncharacterized protein with HEPN domain